MKSLIGKLFGRSARLSALELIILNAVRDCLHSGVADLWDKQVREINKVQRLPEGVEVNFYRMKGSDPTFDDSLAFSNKAEELLVATVSVQIPNLSDALTACVWSVRGFLFSIEYKGNANYFEEASEMELAQELQIDCVVEADLSRALEDV